MTAPTTFIELWEQSVRAHGDRTFLRFEGPDGAVSQWTYREFDELVGQIAHEFQALGVGAERGVHLVLRNSPSFVGSWLATLRVGSYIIASDPMATSHELVDHLERTQPAVSVAATARRGVVEEAVDSLGTGGVVGTGVDGRRPVILAVDEDDPACAGLLATAARDGADAPGEAEWPTVEPGDRAAVMFTSGTTGRPKGVMITQANYAFAGTTMAAAADLGPDDRQLVVLPLFHANAQYYSFASAIAVGASVALMHTFSASGFIEQAARHRATHASLFAGPMRMILARGGPWSPPLPGSADEDHREAGSSSALVLRHCWYAQNLTSDQYATLAAWMGCLPRQLYGMTETIPAVLTDHAEAPIHDSMGFVTEGCQVDVVDADGVSVGPGEVGEIVVGGDVGTTLFAGYLDDPDATAASFRDGWFLTGDRASRTADGRFYFDGRRSDVLKVAGENVSVVEVEAVIGDHPDVFDVVVVGAPDPIRDEVPVAFVVPEPSAESGLDERLAAWSVERLSKAKRPRAFNIVDELPRTSVGKVRKFLLTEAANANAKTTTDATTNADADTDADTDAATTNSD